MIRRHPAIGLTADEHDGEPAAQMRRLQKEPDHLLCPITREMFRDPVFLVGSGHTYERKAIEQHLRNDRTDPLTRARIGTAPVTNRIARNAVQAWLDENPGVTPDGWTSREMPPPQPRGAEYHRPDLEILREWRESCPELRDLWRGDDASHWQGVTWSDRRVTRLRLTIKRLSGELPRLEGLTSLQAVDLSNNQLSGPIPDRLFEGLTSLQLVWLNNNKLSGPIPEKLFEGLTSLQVVELSNNQLSGPIPEKLFEGLTSLRRVSIGHSQLSGPIPEKLFEGLTSLVVVFLNNNQLSGPIPEKLFEGLTSLVAVWLNNNQLSGPIPEKLFEGLTSLQYVFLNNNQLSGPIPEKLFKGLKWLRRVNLSGNQVSRPRAGARIQFDSSDSDEFDSDESDSDESDSDESDSDESDSDESDSD